MTWRRRCGFLKKGPMGWLKREEVWTTANGGLLWVVMRFFRLDGIKQLYSRYQFTICQRELISIEEAPNVDTTPRSVATALSRD
ncbi:hypothetical protein TNCV_17811 [Trichonephila clavipes]|nr:hypothetical protein TNCV_17811 [Trichonephila clavipes]